MRHYRDEILAAGAAAGRILVALMCRVFVLLQRGLILARPVFARLAATLEPHVAPYLPRRFRLRLRYVALALACFLIVALAQTFAGSIFKQNVADAAVTTQVAMIEPASGERVDFAAAKPVAATPAAAPAKTLLQPSRVEKTVRIRPGDTLMNLLVDASVPKTEAFDAIEALRAVYDPRDMRPGHEVKLLFNQNARAFEGLKIDQDAVHSVSVGKSRAGTFEARKHEKETARYIAGARGRIDSSLFAAGMAQNIPNSVLLELIRILSWDIDFQRDLRQGDMFEVMYERYVTEDGVMTDRGNILYATLMLSGTPVTIYRYEMADGTVDYFTPEGRSVRKALLKTPIDGARISSGFGARKHPVLGYTKMHKGVDFAAPRGTPIYAAGDGVIESYGRWSSFGNYARIRHRQGLSTAYAHMNGYAKGLGRGSRVKQGQVIGYVGTTGRSTGPHLHYEVLVDGRQVNPSNVKMQAGQVLKGNDLEAFQGIMAQANQDFESLGLDMKLAAR